MLAAGLLAAALASASPASASIAVSHHAKGGELRDGRLILRGVSRKMSYSTDAGQSGTESVTRVHRRLFLPGAPATRTLHITGAHGDQPTFKLAEPH